MLIANPLRRDGHEKRGEEKEDVKRNLPLNNMDDTNKLNKILDADSKIANKIHLARTKWKI